MDCRPVLVSRPRSFIQHTLAQTQSLTSIQGLPAFVCIAMLPTLKESLPRVCEMLKKAQLTADCITTLPRNTKDTQSNLRWLLLGWDPRTANYEDEAFWCQWSEQLHVEAKGGNTCFPFLAPNCTFTAVFLVYRSRSCNSTCARPKSCCPSSRHWQHQ